MWKRDKRFFRDLLIEICRLAFDNWRRFKKNLLIAAYVTERNFIATFEDAEMLKLTILITYFKDIKTRCFDELFKVFTGIRWFFTEPNESIGQITFFDLVEN